MRVSEALSHFPTFPCARTGKVPGSCYGPGEATKKKAIGGKERNTMKKLKITNNSPVVLGFALVCLGALLLNFLTGGKSNRLLFMTWHSSLKSPLVAG